LALASAPMDGEVALNVAVGGKPSVRGVMSVGLRDCIRPSVMQTAQFGQLWGRHTAAVQANVPTAAVSSPDVFLNVMKSINMHAVDKIVDSACAGWLRWFLFCVCVVVALYVSCRCCVSVWLCRRLSPLHSIPSILMRVVRSFVCLFVSQHKKPSLPVC